MHDDALLKVREAFIEKIGMIVQMEGMSRIAGRMFGLLVFDGEAISFSDLAIRLKVSRASVSSNARFLEERGVIKRLSKPGERQDYFQLADAPYVTMTHRIANRMEVAKNEINKTIDELPSPSQNSSIDGITQRLTAYSEFYDAMNINLLKTENHIKNSKTISLRKTAHEEN